MHVSPYGRFTRVDIFDFWLHWTAGDMPKSFRIVSREKRSHAEVFRFAMGSGQAIIFGSIQGSIQNLNHKTLAT